MPPNQSKKTTHFGYQEVPEDEKAALVAEVFDSVASKYDLMNDVMSLGMHRLWKRAALSAAKIQKGQTVLDAAAGTCDFAQPILKIIGESGCLIASDINANMLQIGRDRLIDKGFIQNIVFVQGDAEALPFPNDHFNRITIAFGFRNVTHKMAALRSMYRVLKPGGLLMILEFSHTSVPFLRQCYDFYSFKIIPKLGELIAQDKKSYDYLVESIRMHPNQDTLKTMMLEAGFEDVCYRNLTGGIVAIHTGYKY